MTNAMHRLQKELMFYSVIAVLFTTIFSWFNLNSVCIMLMVLSRFLYRPVDALKTAFRNKLFLAFLAFCVIGAAGFLYTHDLVNQSKSVSKEATMVAVALFWCAGPVQWDFRKLLSWYYLLLTSACLFCLAVAVKNYRITGDNSVFFYHSLTRPISFNAVFFCVFVVFGILFLLAPNGRPVLKGMSATAAKLLHITLVIFFLGMVILLNSKLLLVVTLLLVIHSFLRHYSFREHKRIFLIAAGVLVALVIGIAVTHNPISDRYRDMQGDLAVVRQPVFNRGLYFNPLQLRLLEFRFASEITREHHSLLFGVSPGDSQDLLDEKYVQTNMYIGNALEGPNRHIRGFLGYNFHNQYLETLVRSGLLGLVALVAIFVLLFIAAHRHGTRETWLVPLILAVFFIPEAPLTLQHGVFIFCFFPLFALAAPQKP